MAKPNPPQKKQPRPPTLRLDAGQAWRQSDHAIIIPIVYDLPDPARGTTKPDEIIIPISSLTPAPQPFVSATPPQREIPTTPQALPKAEPVPPIFAAHVHPDSVYFLPSGSAFKRAHHLSIAVPLLLLAGIAVVFFAWMAFR